MVVLWLAMLASSGLAMKMVALDLDGTLLNGAHQVSASSRSKLAELAELGVLIVVASGRSGPAMYPLIEALALPQLQTFAVAYNGACCFEFPRGFNHKQQQHEGGAALPLPGGKKKIFGESFLAETTAKTILRFAEARGLLAQVYVGNDIFVNCKSDDHRQFTRRYAELTGCDHRQTDEYPTNAVLKLLLMTDDPDAVVADLKRHDDITQSAHVVRGSPPFFVELLRRDVCKGNGLRSLCHKLGVDLDDVIAFGDGENDLEFLQLAGLGVAMRNGRDVVKEAADRVTDEDNDHDGVARFLTKLQAEGILPSLESVVSVKKHP